MDTDSDIDLTAPSILDTESDTDIVDSVILLKLDRILDILSDIDVDSDNVLKAANNLLTESDMDTDSDILLKAPYNLDTLSLTDIDGSVMVLNADIILDIESDMETLLSLIDLNALNTLLTLSLTDHGSWH